MSKTIDPLPRALMETHVQGDTAQLKTRTRAATSEWVSKHSCRLLTQTSHLDHHITGAEHRNELEMGILESKTTYTGSVPWACGMTWSPRGEWKVNTSSGYWRRVRLSSRVCSRWVKWYRVRACVGPRWIKVRLKCAKSYINSGNDGNEEGMTSK